MLGGAWAWLASSATAIFVALVVLVILIRGGFHRGPNGKLSRQRCASVFILSASAYTFGVLSVSELLIHGPKLSYLIHYGFGDQRIAWLLSGIVLDTVFRIWDEFSHD